VGTEEDRIRDKYTPLNKPTTGSSAPNLQRIIVEKLSKYIAPVIQIKLNKERDSITESNSSSICSDFNFTEKNEKVSIDELHKMQRNLINLIQNVGDYNSIKGFKKFYKEFYMLNGKLDKHSEFCWFAEGWSFLHEASKRGNTDIAKFLIFGRMQDPNMVSESLWTPLQLSWHYGHVKLTMLLCESPKLDPDIVTDYSRGSASEISWRNMSDECVNLIKCEKDESFISDKHLNCLKVIYKLKNLPFNLKDFAEAPLSKRSSSFHEKKAENKDNTAKVIKRKKNNRANSHFDASSSDSHKIPDAKQISIEDIKIACVKYLTHLQIKIPANFFEVLDIMHDKSKVNYPIESIPYMIEYDGYIGKSQALGLKVSYRWFKLNPTDGNFIEYKTKEDCPNKPHKIIPLNSINSVWISTNRWMVKKALFYWEIDNKQIMCNRTSQCQNLWILKLLESIQFSSWIEALKNIRFTEVPIPDELEIGEKDKNNIERFVDKILSHRLQRVEIVDTDSNGGLIHYDEKRDMSPILKTTSAKHIDNLKPTVPTKTKSKLSVKRVPKVNLSLNNVVHKDIK
jgi:hypothetical protein